MKRDINIIKAFKNEIDLITFVFKSKKIYTKKINIKIKRYRKNRSLKSFWR